MEGSAAETIAHLRSAQRGVSGVGEAVTLYLPDIWRFIIVSEISSKLSRFGLEVNLDELPSDNSSLRIPVSIIEPYEHSD